MANPFAPRLRLDELLGSLSDGEPMLDLKGRDPRLSTAVLELLRPHLAAGRRVMICARSERLLGPFAGLPGVAIVRSVGNRRQLRALASSSVQLDGISIHERLLDRETVRDLRRRAAFVMSWPVTTLERARELAAWGVDGLITEDFDLMRALGKVAA